MEKNTVTETKPKGITGTSTTELKDRAVYHIQFLTSEKELAKDSPLLKGITDFMVTKDRLYRYLTKESAANLDEAKNLQKSIQEMGFKDAFIVPFYKGERISFDEARRINSAK